MSEVDEGEDYQWLKNDGPRNTLNPLNMVLVLASQPIRVLEDLITELGETTWLAEIVVKPTGAVKEVGHTEEVRNAENIDDTEVEVDATQSKEIEVGGVRETLTEVLADVEPILVKSKAVKTGP